MGRSRSDADDWKGYTKAADATRATRGTAGLYTNTSGVKDEFRPSAIGIRESRVSDANPRPTPLILALDCTGSMSSVLNAAKVNLGTLMKEIYEREPITDPHILVSFFADVAAGSGSNSLQVTQFESDLIIADQMEKLYNASGGGGNDSESYSLPLYFAHYKTDCDAFKEGRKGYIFTIGDDGPPDVLTKSHIRQVFGEDEPFDHDLSYKELLELCSENWEVFHLNLRQGGTGQRKAIENWPALLGERFIQLDDIEKMPEVIAAILQVLGGTDKASVVDSFKDPGTALVVGTAIGGLTVGASGGSDIVTMD